MARKWDAPDAPEIDPEFAHWFAGFVDGEGCFSVRKKNVNGCETYDCQFSITLRADDKPIILEIKKQLGDIGSIADRPSSEDTQRTGRDTRRLRRALRVRRRTRSGTGPAPAPARK
jgi:LAGLIDADG endonuclease